jgi:septum site-determining protein MinC
MSSSFTADQEPNYIPEQADSSQREPKAVDAPSKGPCMQLKGSLLPMTVLELNYFELEQFASDLQAKTTQAPDFFENLPIVIGLEKFDDAGSLPFKQLIDACREHSVKVVAVRGGSELLQSAARQAGLGIFAKQKERKVSDAEAPTLTEQAQPEHKSEQAEAPIERTQIKPETPVIRIEPQISKIIHRPIRSGQQVYASDGDLIVMASVSAGAEILADGNIHVYGALRGRALAGVKGNTKARIFCHNLGAELVSIAGQYKISEDIGSEHTGKSCQVYLENDAICFKEIEL